jgi:hypothetical protein
MIVVVMNQERYGVSYRDKDFDVREKHRGLVMYQYTVKERQRVYLHV